MTKALYRKYRSTSLDTVVGQDHITSLLKRHIELGTVSHAYLLTGPRGVGKTSIARIIAHEINGLAYDGSNHLDIIEIDAASNNGVEDVRDLRDKVHIAPTSAAKKVYIIDEVHMLSRQAFNALLKTLEEPPSHVVFILATTDADKLPATILSRVQRYNFRSITEDDAIKHLRELADKESIQLDDEALSLIVEHGNGSFRDSIGLLDQLRHSAQGDKLSRGDVEQAIGLGDASIIDSIVEAYRSQSIELMAQSISLFEKSGTQAGMIASQLIKKLTSSLPQHPADSLTLERLLEVHQSAYPYIKLLTALITERAADSPQATKAQPVVKPQPAESAKPAIKPQPKKPSPSPKPPTTTRAAQATPAPVVTGSIIEQPFDWPQLLTSAKQRSTGLHTLLAKAGHSLTDSSLTIYAGKSFGAKQLNTAAKLSDLHAVLAECGWSALDVEILGTTKPPSDSRAADVAAIMGGGEEVDLEDE